MPVKYDDFLSNRELKTDEEKHDLLFKYTVLQHKFKNRFGKTKYRPLFVDETVGLPNDKMIPYIKEIVEVYKKAINRQQLEADFKAEYGKDYQTVFDEIAKAVFDAKF